MRCSEHKAYRAPVSGERLWNRYFCLMILLTSALNFGNYFVGSSFSLWVVDMGGSNTTYGLLHSLFSLVVLLTRPIAGWIVDHGRRRTAFICSTALFAVAMILMLYAPTFGVFAAMRLVQGMGNGCALSIAHTSSYDYIPPDKMDKGIGYVAMFTSLMSALTATFSVGTYNQSGPGTLVLWSVLSLAVAAALSALVVFRVPAERKPFRLREIFDLSEMFERRALVPAVLAALSVNLGFGLRSYIILYGRSLGIANPGWFTTISALGLVIVRFALDLIPRNGHSTTRRVGFAYAVFVAYLVCLGVCRSAAVFFLAAGLWAVVYGILTPELQSMAVRAVPRSRFGAAGSTFLCSTDLGMILGSYFGGLMADHAGYRAMFGWALVPVCLCALCFLYWGKKRAPGSGMV